MIKLRVILLTLVALALAAAAFADAGSPRTCRHADQLAGQGRLADARTEYVAALDDTTTAGCARDGLERVDTLQCRRAARLAAQDQVDAAVKLAASVGAEDPPGATADCSRLAPRASCGAAATLVKADLLADAVTYYVSLLHGPTARRCANAGIADVTRRECAAAARLDTTDRAKALAAIAAQPVSGATSC
jgi:hypothetical protein